MTYKDIKLEKVKVGDLVYIFIEGFGPEGPDMVPIITSCILVLEPLKRQSGNIITLRGITAPIPDYYDPTDADMEKYTHEMIKKWVKEQKFIEQDSFYVGNPEEYAKIAVPPNFSLSDKTTIITGAF